MRDATCRAHQLELCCVTQSCELDNRDKEMGGTAPPLKIATVWELHTLNSLHAINNYLWVCPYAELIRPRCVEMASLEAQLLTVSLRARIVPTDEKGRFHYDLEGCRYPSRVYLDGNLAACCGSTKIRRRSTGTSDW